MPLFHFPNPTPIYRITRTCYSQDNLSGEVEGTGDNLSQNVEKTFTVSVASSMGKEVFLREILPDFSMFESGPFLFEATKLDGSPLVMLRGAFSFSVNENR